MGTGISGSSLSRDCGDTRLAMVAASRPKGTLNKIDVGGPELRSATGHTRIVCGGTD